MKKRGGKKKENTLNEKTTAGPAWDEWMGGFEANEVVGTKKLPFDPEGNVL